MMNIISDSPTVAVYNEHAEEFFNKYQRLNFSELHSVWYNNLRVRGIEALDVGAGSGRDAVELNRRGWCVTAVDPADQLLEIAARRSPSPNIKWFNSKLPELEHVDGPYDLILVSAVWQHLTEEDQEKSIERLSDLISKHGNIIITLRSGPFYDQRANYPVDLDKLKQWAQCNALHLEDLGNDPDFQRREGVSWSTIRLTPW